MGLKLKLLLDLMLLLNLVDLHHNLSVVSGGSSVLSTLVVLRFDFVFNLCFQDTFIQKTKKLYLDTRTQRNIAKLNDELYEVHQIMTRNVQEVLGVGEKLDRKRPFSFFDYCALYY